MQSSSLRMPVDTLDFVKVTEAAALAASRWMGRGERDIEHRAMGDDLTVAGGDHERPGGIVGHDEAGATAQ